MTAFTLLAEEPEIGWRVFLVLVGMVTVVVAVLGAACWLAALLVSLGGDEELTDNGQSAITAEWTEAWTLGLQHDEPEDTRRVELGAAALGKGAKR